jgi:natural product precursor
MKKINLRGINQTLSEKELKRVVGGCLDDCACESKSIPYWCNPTNPTCTKKSDCNTNQLCYTCDLDGKRYCA